MRTLLSLPLVLAAPAAAQTIPTAPSPAYNRAIAAGYKAAMYCSGIFVAGRTPAQIDRDELAGIYPEYDRIVPTLKAEVINNTAIAVTVAFDPALPPRLAVWRPWHGGCVLRPIGTPVRLVPLWHVPRPSIRPADPDRWPIGDAGIAPQPPALVTAAVTRAFDARSYGTKSKTTGVVIVRDGEVVAERYADGWGPFVANRTWSVA